jgi:hypothetical protein
VEPDESNAFARALKAPKPLTPLGRRLRLVFGVTLSLVLAACLTLAFVFLGGLLVGGVRRGDYRALGAAVAVIAMTVVMARGRRRPK